MEPRARLRSPCDTSIGTSCAAETAVEASRSIDMDADAPGDAFSALPLRPCNAAALANSGVPMLVSQGRCDGFTWISTTAAGQMFYSAIMEHGPKHGFGSLSTCRWLLFGTGAAPDGQAAGRAERGHGWMHALFGNARPHKLASAMWVEDLRGSSDAAFELAEAADAAWPACAGAQLVPTEAGRWRSRPHSTNTPGLKPGLVNTFFVHLPCGGARHCQVPPVPLPDMPRVRLKEWSK